MNKKVVFLGACALLCLVAWIAWSKSSSLDDMAIVNRQLLQGVSSKRAVSRTLISSSDAGKEVDTIDQQLSAARKLVDSGEVEQGSKVLANILSKNDSNIEALLEMSLIELLDRGRPKNALPYLVKALQVDPSNDHLLGEVAKIYLETSQVAEGLRFFQNLGDHLPNTAAINLRLGQLYYYNKDFQSALAVLKSIESTPNYGFHAQSLRARVLLSQGQVEKGLKVFLKAEKGMNQNIRIAMKAGKSVDFLVEWLETMQVEAAQYLIRHKMYREAEDVLYRLSERIPADPEVMQLLDMAKSGKVSQAG